VTVYEPAADGVNETPQDATPVVPVAASAQLPELPKDPVAGELVKLTVPVGVVAPLARVSVTVAVHVVALPLVIDAGEHDTAVAVESVAAIDEDTPLLVLWATSPP
jgi:hypothetical protein